MKALLIWIAYLVLAAIYVIVVGAVAHAENYVVDLAHEPAKPPANDRWASSLPRCSDKLFEDTVTRHLYGGASTRAGVWPVAMVKLDAHGLVIVLWTEGAGRQYRLTRAVDAHRGFLDFEEASFFVAIDPDDANGATFSFGLVMHDASGATCGTKYVGRAKRSS